MARNEKVLITREEFCSFYSTVEELKMQDIFENVTLYHRSIYFGNSHTYISWGEDAPLEILQTIVKGINAIFNTNFVIVEDR